MERMRDEQTSRNTTLGEGRGQELPVYVGIFRYIFAVLASLFTLFVTVQVFFAGLAIFVDAGNWNLHTSFVRSFAFLPIVLIVLAFAGRLPRDMCWQSFGLFVMIVLQFLTVVFSANISFLSALHPVIALGLFWTSFVLSKKSWSQSLGPK